MFSKSLGDRKGALAIAIGIGFYTLRVGANATVVRAALLSWLTLLEHPSKMEAQVTLIGMMEQHIFLITWYCLIILLPLAELV